MSELARICKYRRCDVDLDAIDKRPNADYCCTDHKEAERRLRRREAADGRAPGVKPRKSAHNGPRRSTRQGFGTTIYVRAEEARYVLAAIRGGKRPRLKAPERQRLQAKVTRAAERLAA